MELRIKAKSGYIIRLASLLVFALCLAAQSYSTPAVELVRVPDGGIQPQTAVDQQGTVHLVYFKGDPAAGDLFYARSTDGKKFSTPIRVNSVIGTAVALGNIRGARITVGRRGRVYVAWNGSRKAAEANSGRVPLLFSRLDNRTTAFEPERNLIRSAYGLDGGSAIAADQSGNVYVVWHAPLPGTQGEASRRVWIVRSKDDGQTFEPEHVAWNEPTGICGCCSLNAAVAPDGRLYILFRSAYEVVHRDIYLLSSTDHGQTFHGSDISPWKVGYCVMSTSSFGFGPETLAAWETEKNVHLGRIEPGKVSDVFVGKSSDQKYPALAEAKSGATLLAWTEGMGWKRGGSLHWQLFDRTGKTTGAPGMADGVPAWSLVSAYATRDGEFAILY
jgi:hypothetical protein